MERDGKSPTYIYISNILCNMYCVFLFLHVILLLYALPAIKLVDTIDCRHRTPEQEDSFVESKKNTENFI